MMKRKRVLVLMAALVVSGLVVVGFSTTLKPMTLEEMVSGSDMVVVGTVQSVEAVFCEACRLGLGDEKICTFSELKIEDVLSTRRVMGLEGEPAKKLEGRTVPVMVPGGQVGSWYTHVEATASFEPGERVLVFLYRADYLPGEIYRVYGWAQGDFTVLEDPRAPGVPRVYGNRYNSHLVTDGTPLAEVKEVVGAIR